MTTTTLDKEQQQNVNLNADMASEGAYLLRECVQKAMNNYFSQLDGQDTNGVYQLVLAEVEEPLLEAVMKYTRGNQSKAAIILGINRGTLRTKLKKYGVS